MTLPAARLRLTALLLALVTACGGAAQAPAPGAPPSPEPAGTEQTLADLFNLTALYQRMGRLAAGAPLPFVGSTAAFAGRSDSTLVVLALSLDSRALSFQRINRLFVARYRVELTLTREGVAPLRFARDEVVQVATLQETQRTDEAVVFQQALLLAPGTYGLAVVVRDAGSTSTSRAEAPLEVKAFGAGSFSAPALVYASTPRPTLWSEPDVVLNPRGLMAQGGDSLRIVVEGYNLAGPTRLPFEVRDEQDRVLVDRDLEFAGGKAVETRTIVLPPNLPTLGRINVRTGEGAAMRQTVALVSFSRSWVVTNYDNLITLLRFLPTDGWLDRLAKADPAERATVWRQFWVETDPRPDTPENELLDLYFTRVAIANERFRDEGAGQGWRSERGEVFIALGPPDQEYESPPGTDQRIVQWVYNEWRAVLTFTGTMGFSRVRLTPASRSEFARLRALARQQLRNP